MFPLFTWQNVVCLSSSFSSSIDVVRCPYHEFFWLQILASQWHHLSVVYGFGLISEPPKQTSQWKRFVGKMSLYQEDGHTRLSKQESVYGKKEKLLEHILYQRKKMFGFSLSPLHSALTGGHFRKIFFLVFQSRKMFMERRRD